MQSMASSNSSLNYSVSSSLSRRTSEVEKEDFNCKFPYIISFRSFYLSLSAPKEFSPTDIEKEKKLQESSGSRGITIELGENRPAIPRVENRGNEVHQRIRRTRIRLTESMPCDIPIRLSEYKPIIIDEDEFLEINRVTAY